MIGVNVTTSLRTGPTNSGVQSGRFHVAGVTEFGPVGGSRVVDSIAKFLAIYGDRTAYSSNVFDTVRMFFEEGGSEAVISRVVGPAAAGGSLSLMDSADVATLRVEAIEPGPHSQNISVKVDTLDESSYTLTIYRGGEVISRYEGLTSPAEAVTRSASNPFIRISTLGSVTAAPGDNPKGVDVTALPAGNDDRANITVEHIIAALDAGTGAEGGCVAVPGYSANVIGAALAEHAKRAGKIALTAPAAGATPAQAIADAAGLTVESGDHIGLFYPHLTIPDAGATRTISPEGYVAAVRARAHRDVGFWQVPAGDRAVARWVLGTVTPVSIDVNNELSDALVNGIVTTGSKVRLYGWQSLSADREGLGLLSFRDGLNFLMFNTKSVLEPFVFSVNDSNGHLRSYIESAVIGLLDPIAKAGGFFAGRDAEGEIVDPGYRVSVDSSLNPLTLLAENKVMVSVGVRMAPTAQLIQVEIIKVPLSGTV